MLSNLILTATRTGLADAGTDGRVTHEVGSHQPRGYDSTPDAGTSCLFRGRPTRIFSSWGTELALREGVRTGL